MKKKKIIVLIFAVFLVGCSKEKSKDYYKKHFEEAVKVDNACNFSNSTYSAKDCANADDALFEIHAEADAKALGNLAKGGTDPYGNTIK